MAIIQVSKIQLRRGPEIDLPGAPTSLTPLTFGPGLDLGEIAFATDSGRLFIGHNPKSTQPNNRRSEFPYQNVEILTENSSATLRRIHEQHHRDVGTAGFHTATLVPTPVFRDVTIDRTPSPLVYKFMGSVVAATMTYFVFDNLKQPFRQGIIQIMSDRNEMEAYIQDTAVASRPSEPSGADTLDPEASYDAIEFKVVRAGSPSDQHFRLQYRSALNETMRLYFSILRPIP